MLDGKFLGMQFNYGGKMVQGLSQLKFPQEFSLSVNKKPYSNEVESIKLIEEIVLPYVKEKQERLRKSDQKVLVILDVFRGQITDDVLNLFKENNHERFFDPANMTNLLQTLDLTVNGYAKTFCCKRFSHWYME